MKSVSYVSGKPKEVHVLDYGLFKVHANGRVIGICGFLIRTTAGENILVDTGFPRKYVYDIATSSTEDRLGEFGEVLELTEENLPEAQLARAGVKMDDIDLLIMTHTHIDHVGGISDFPGRP
ncbi:MAG: MBL fold metallo-hydrolase, partial [Erythrobacter sp.]